MFEIRCLVGDKSLHKSLHALKGLTLEPPVVLSVTGEGEEGNSGSKSSVAIATDFIKNEKREEVAAKDLRDYLVAQGFSKNGYSYALKTLLEKGMLKKTSKKFTYKVVK